MGTDVEEVDFQASQSEDVPSKRWHQIAGRTSGVGVGERVLRSLKEIETMPDLPERESRSTEGSK